jgi:predicted nucleotide-binding protein
MDRDTSMPRKSSRPQTRDMSAATADDAALSVEALKKLPLASRVAFLSACETAFRVGDNDLRVSGSNAKEVEAVTHGLIREFLQLRIGAVAKDASTKVFVVHGHDDGAREAVARFVEKIGLEAIILTEQPNGGRTIIEKFEDRAGEAGFAVVLLTPDDAGSVHEDPSASRPRQNVIFELGYFVGRLGRGRVCLLRKGNIESFSDFHGVVYTELDEGGAWKVRLARELEAAGLVVDMAKAARA